MNDHERAVDTALNALHEAFIIGIEMDGERPVVAAIDALLREER
jgi:hypothetical protein